jgi:hypothetical protein
LFFAKGNAINIQLEMKPPCRIEGLGSGLSARYAIATPVKSREKRLRAEEKLMRLKAERAFLNAGGARGESARRWPSVLTEEVRHRGGKPDLQRGVGG